MKILVESMEGIGDQIYARPFIKTLARTYGRDLYVRSVLPRLYEDLDISLLQAPISKYRTQAKTQQRESIKYAEEPSNVATSTRSPALSPIGFTIDYRYDRASLRNDGIVSSIERAFAISTRPASVLQFDLPNLLVEPPIYREMLEMCRPLAVVRPVTERCEWICRSRSPEPDYISWCAHQLMNAGYTVISLADCEEGEEWIVGTPPPAHFTFHYGELTIYEVLGLLKRVSVVVGGPGFITPAAIAAGCNLFTIFGGRGAYDNPRTLFDPRMNLKKIRWVLPDNFCRCNKMEHECDKRISNLDDHFMNFMRGLQW